MRAYPSAAPVATPSNRARTARISGTESSAATKCISDVPGLVKHVLTPEVTSVRISACAPVGIVPGGTIPGAAPSGARRTPGRGPVESAGAGGHGTGRGLVGAAPFVGALSGTNFGSGLRYFEAESQSSPGRCSL